MISVNSIYCWKEYSTYYRLQVSNNYG